jgi:hypothetical protein
VGQEVAISINDKFTRGALDDFTPGQFAAYVKGAVARQRADFLRAAKAHRTTYEELTIDGEDEDGTPETYDSPAIREYVEHRAPCSRLIPADTSNIDPEVLDIMCEAIRNRSTRHLETQPRTLPTATGIDAEIMRILRDPDEWVWDEGKPNYVPSSSDALDPDYPYGAWRLPTYAEVGQRLRGQGLRVTDEAVKQRIKRFRAKAKMV